MIRIGLRAVLCCRYPLNADLGIIQTATVEGLHRDNGKDHEDYFTVVYWGSLGITGKRRNCCNILGLRPGGLQTLIWSSGAKRLRVSGFRV